jgi:transcriptional regulator GlxA family with amidase domain
MFGLCNLIIQEIDSQLTEQKKYLITWNIDELKMTLNSCQDQSDFIRLLSYCRKKISKYSDEGAYTDNTLENAMKWIECNYKDPNLSLNELASQVNVSPNHLCKVFSKKLNISPMQYVMKVRISKAEKYLRTTDKQIKEIADLTGFNYSYYFSRTFKKITGLTPLEYRQG